MAMLASAWVRSGIVAHFWTGFIFSLLWVLVCDGGGSLHLGQRWEVGPEGLELHFWGGYAFSWYANSHNHNGSICHSGEQCQYRKEGAGAVVWWGLGGMRGWSWQAKWSIRKFLIWCLCSGAGSKQVCVHALQEYNLFLTGLCKPHWLSNQLRASPSWWWISGLGAWYYAWTLAP